MFADFLVHLNLFQLHKFCTRTASFSLEVCEFVTAKFESVKSRYDDWNDSFCLIILDKASLGKKSSKILLD